MSTDRTRSRLKSLMATTVAALAIGCAADPALSHYVRSEFPSPARTRWLHENCQFQGPASSKHFGVADDGVPRQSYWQVLDFDAADTFPEWRAFAYVCPKPPPWTRDDGEWVAELYEMAHSGSEDLTKCFHGRPANEDRSGPFYIAPKPPKVKVEVIEPGRGPRANGDSYVRIRFGSAGRGTLKKGAGDNPKREEEKTSHDVRHLRPAPVERVVHVSCMPYFAPAILKLGAGGRARVIETVELFGGSSVTVPWNVALLEIGGEELLRRDLGLAAKR